MANFSIVASSFGRFLLALACLGAVGVSAGLLRLHTSEYRSETYVAVRFVGVGTFVTVAALIAALFVS